MIYLDIPWWVVLVVGIVLWIAWFAVEIIIAPMDPDPEYSRLDRMDGLGSPMNGEKK